MTVGTGDIGDIPNGIGSWTILQGGTRHGVSEFLDALRSISQGVPSRTCPIIRFGIPDTRIEGNVLGLLLILLLHVVGVDGIEKSRAIDADGAFESDFVIGWKRARVESCLRNSDFGIYEGIRLTVGEFHRDATWHGCHIEPLEVDLAFIDRCLEWGHGLGLRHTRDLTNVGIGCVGNSVEVGACRWMIDHKEITIAEVVGTVASHALAVSVGWMAVDATVTHPSWAQSLARLFGEGVKMLEEILSFVKANLHAFGVFDGRSCGRIAGILCGSQYAAWIPFLSREHVVGFSKHVFLRCEMVNIGSVIILT